MTNERVEKYELRVLLDKKFRLYLHEEYIRACPQKELSFSVWFERRLRDMFHYYQY